MTEQPQLTLSDDANQLDVGPPKPPRRDLVPWLYVLGFLALAAAVFYLWRYPNTAGDASAEQTVQLRLSDTEARLTRLEQRPAVDLGKIVARVDAIEEGVTDQKQLTNRLGILSGRIEALSGHDQMGLDAIKQQLDALTSKVAVVESNADDLNVVVKGLNRTIKVQMALFALAAGRPVGDVPGAPEALARYAHVAPPTEAQLRLRFPADERVALATEQPDQNDAPFVDRIWDRAQGLITIRRGGEVLVGNSTAVILGRAQTALDIGDIAGAAAAVNEMKGRPAQAMAHWLADANALLGARSALADMADKT